MHLQTNYAPGSFLKPCLVVDTVFNSKTKETALRFVEALNVDHVFSIVQEGKRAEPLKDSGWVVIQQHETRQGAIAFHLDLVAPFHNGGSEEEWNEGWEPYLALYEKWCPQEARHE